MANIDSVRTTDSRVNPEAVAKVELDGSIGPREYVKGDTITVRGGIKNPSSVYRPEVRVVVKSEAAGTEDTVNLGRVTTGGQASFSANLGAVYDRSSVDVDVEVQARPFSYLGWSTTDTAAFSVDVVSEGEKQRGEYFDYLPYVVAGGGAGYAISNATGRDPRRGMVAGGATGAFAKRYAPKDVSLPSFPTTEVALVAALFIGGGYFLSSAGDTIPLLGQ